MAKISSDAKKILAGAPQAAQQFIMSQNSGGKLTSGEAQRLLNQWNSQNTQNTPLAGEDQLPDSLKNDPAYSALPKDMKEIVLYNYQVQKTNDNQKAINLSNALQQATEQAEPYWKNILMVAQDEVLRSFEQQKGDYDSSVQRQLRIVDNINEDLAYNKQFLSLEEQSALATIGRNYQVQHENLVDSAAGAGLTFSTKRKIAEQRLTEENKGMVESTKRQAAKQQRDIDMNAQRSILETQKSIEDTTRKFGDFTTNLGRSAEKYLGTSGLPSLPGYTPLGAGGTPVTGQVYEQKVQDIENRKKAIAGELNANSLNLSLSNYL